MLEAQKKDDEEWMTWAYRRNYKQVAGSLYHLSESYEWIPENLKKSIQEISNQF